MRGRVMTKRGRHTFALVLVVALASSAAALAGPLKGKTYEGGVPSSGTNLEGHHARIHAGGNIVLRVARGAGSVTVRFSSSAPLIYCNTQEKLHSQSGKAASISRSGTFKASIAERFGTGPGPPAIVQVVSGKFSGRTVRGTIHTEQPECGGVSSFSATAR
jgi:hypothetical protein